MADDDTGPTQDDTPPTGEQPDQGPSETEKWKVLARKHERDAKAAAAKLASLEDKDKTEVERHASRATAAEQRAAEAEAKVLRLEVADDAGIKPAHRKYLSGATEAELRESAKGIKDDFADAYRDTPVRAGVAGRPVESLRPGQVGAAPTATDPNEWFRQYANQNRRRTSTE